MKLHVTPLLDIATQAGKAIMEIYNSEDFGVETKADDSPLTIADKASNEVIEAGLHELNPEIPILSEEGKDIPFETRSKWSSFWLVDPLDGTKEFIKKNGEFTVNIALIEDGEPVFGIVYAPAIRTLYWGNKTAAYKLKTTDDHDWNELEQEPLHSKPNLQPYTIVGSRSHSNEQTQKFVESKRLEHSNIEFLSMGSSLKLCLVAEGLANVYPRLGPTMEWDTAAAHAIVVGSGARVYQVGGGPLVYNKKNLLNPEFIVEA